jgi:hypothetical protein
MSCDGGLDRVGDDRPHLLRQRVVLVLVEHDLELLGVLVIALQHADLRDVGEAEDAVGGGVVELGRVEQAAVHRRRRSRRRAARSPRRPCR